jgi:hypothetical protein
MESPSFEVDMHATSVARRSVRAKPRCFIASGSDTHAAVPTAPEITAVDYALVSTMSCVIADIHVGMR